MSFLITSVFSILIFKLDSTSQVCSIISTTSTTTTEPSATTEALTNTVTDMTNLSETQSTTTEDITLPITPSTFTTLYPATSLPTGNNMN